MKKVKGSDRKQHIQLTTPYDMVTVQCTTDFLFLATL